MAALYKKEVLVRPNSTANFETAMNFALNWLMTTFQDVEANKDSNGNYIDYFFADVFFANGHFANSGQLWRIFSTPCATMYSLTPGATGRIEFMVNDLVGLQSQITANGNDISDAQNALDGHEARITTLETTSTAVEATVI